MPRGPKATIQQESGMKVEDWPIGKVTPYARNPRVNEGAVARVKASLKEFGWQQPIVVDTNGVIVVGHTRHLAALELGMEFAPVHTAAHLTPAQIKAYRIADNKTGELAFWDDELLGLEFNDLEALDYDLSGTGFDASEIEAAQMMQNFVPDDSSGQGRLDEIQPQLVKCPECGCGFDGRKHRT